MKELEQAAREFVETLLAREVCLSDGECTIVQQAALELLADQRQRIAELEAEVARLKEQAKGPHSGYRIL